MLFTALLLPTNTYNKKAKYTYFFAGGSVILTSRSLSITEGGSNNLCVQLVARQGILTQALVVPLSVTLDGKAGIFKTKQLANIKKCKDPLPSKRVV